MKISIERNDTAALVAIDGQIDDPGATELKDHFSALEIEGLQEVVLDFGLVTRIGSAGISQLLVLYKNLASNGGTVRLENVSPSQQELFVSLKLDDLFTITPQSL